MLSPLAPDDRRRVSARHADGQKSDVDRRRRSPERHNRAGNQLTNGRRTGCRTAWRRRGLHVTACGRAERDADGRILSHCWRRQRGQRPRGAQPSDNRSGGGTDQGRGRIQWRTAAERRWRASAASIPSARISDVLTVSSIRTRHHAPSFLAFLSDPDSIELLVGQPRPFPSEKGGHRLLR